MTEEEQDKMEKDILFQIDMQLYNEFNDKFCEINDNLGNYYSYKDLEDLEKAEKEKEIKLLREAVRKQQEIIKNQSYTNKKLKKKIKTIRKERNKLKANIEKIQDYCRKILAFERRLKRDKTTPDLFNQGRFATCDDILKILKGETENDTENK